MKKWQKKWFDELNDLPPIKENIKNMPLNVEQSSIKEENFFHRFLRMIKAHKTRFIAGLSCSVAMIVCLIVAIPLMTNTPPIQQYNGAYVTVDINPSVVFSVDKDGNTDKIISLNADGDVILSDSDMYSSLKGIPVNNAVVKFVDYSAKLGFIDFDKKSAIRISACEEKETSLADNVVKSTENYFKEKGAMIVVASQKIDISTLANKLNVSATESFNDLKNKTEEISEIFTEKTTEWQNYYNEIFSENHILDTIKFGVNEIYEKEFKPQEEKYLAVKEIYQQNELIKNYPSNTLKRDYWWIKASLIKPENAELVSLYDDMTQLLISYENKYDDKIIGQLELNIKLEHYENIVNSYKFISEQVNITLDKLKENVFIENLLSASEKYSSVLNWSEIPDTYNEFMGRVNEFCLLRINQFKDSYNKVREKIEDATYTDHINEIMTEFGSLNNYFDSLR